MGKGMANREREEKKNTLTLVRASNKGEKEENEDEKEGRGGPCLFCHWKLFLFFTERMLNLSSGVTHGSNAFGVAAVNVFFYSVYIVCTLHYATLMCLSLLLT